MTSYRLIRRWFLFVALIAHGCSEADLNGPAEDQSARGRFQKPTLELKEDKFVQISWRLPGDAVTSTELQRRGVDGDVWSEYIPVGQTPMTATTFLDGPLEGWVQYRIRWHMGSMPTEWVISEPIEALCIGDCSPPERSPTPASPATETNDEPSVSGSVDRDRQEPNAGNAGGHGDEDQGNQDVNHPQDNPNEDQPLDAMNEERAARDEPADEQALRQAADDPRCSPIARGHFFVGNTGYYSNGRAYCGFPTMEAWVQSGGPENAPRYAELPACMDDHGVCQPAPEQCEPIPEGYFFVGNTGYYSNGRAYCGFPTWDAWLQGGGPEDGAEARRYAALPGCMDDHGVCQQRDPECQPIARGHFFVGGTGYYSNGQAYCGFPTWEAWLQSGGPENGADAPRHPALPECMDNHGICQAPQPECEPIPRGHFWVGNTGYYSNGQAFCGLSNWDDWLNSGGPRNGADAPRFEALPACMDNHGVCEVQAPACQPIPRGHFWVGNTGYYSNGAAYCGLRSWQDWLNSGGPQNGAAAPRFDALPACMANHGICQVAPPAPACQPIPRGHFFVGATGYYSNGQAYCGFPTWDAWVNSGGPRDASRARRYAALPHCMDNHGICR